MQKLFTQILVPVDFSPKSKMAVEESAELARLYECDLHLLYVLPLTPFTSLASGEIPVTTVYDMVDNSGEAERKLLELCAFVRSKSGNRFPVHHACVPGTWNRSVIEYITEKNIDLVVTGQKSTLPGKRKISLNPDIIAERTMVPVITIPSNKRLTRLFSIVIPVTEFLPVKKLMYGIYLGSRHGTTIKLLAVEDEKSHASVQHYLKKSYQLIRDNCTVKVELETVRHTNVAAAVHDFAKAHEVDLIILNPGTQTRMPGFFSSVLGRFIQKYAAPPVMTVAPFS